VRASPQRQPCLGLICCAAPGILLSELVSFSLPLACLASFCFALATFLGRRSLPFCLFVLTLFCIRHELDWRRNPGRFPADLLNQGVSVIHATGVVTADPVSAGYSYRVSHSRFEMRVTGLTVDDRVFKTDFSAQVYWSGPPPDWGDEVAFTASIASIPPPRNPGEFNLPAWLARRGIFVELSCPYPDENRVLAHGKGDPLIAWARSCRAFLQRRLSAGIEDDPEIAGLIQTITLGLKQETPAADRDLFQHVGALHLFVVNGLHIALLTLILSLLLKPLYIRRRAFALVIIPILFAYALVTGLSPGSVRAAIMAAVMFGASFVERRPFSFNTLAATALILLLWDTNELFQAGFQFSFGVVAAIILFADLFQKPLLPIGLPDAFLPRLLWTPWQRAREVCWRQVSGLAAVSIAASFGSFPFSAGYFNLVTPSGFVANLLLVPLAFCILAQGIFSLLTSAVGVIPLLFNNANWLLASCMLGIVHFFALLPGGHFFVSTSSGMLECRITVLDLKPGQAIVIQSPGSVWLVDCGSQTSYSRTVRPFLQSSGVNRLDGLILTHGAANSIGAYQNVIDDFAPREIVESSLTDRSATRRALHAALEKAHLPKSIVESGDQLQLGPVVQCSILFPPAGLDASTATAKSLVLRIEYGTTRVLLMSDSGFTGEHWLLDHTHDLSASVLILDGQSSDTAGTEEFIGAVHPFAAIRGEPGYAAPIGQDRRWAGGLYSMGVTPFLQTEAGAVTININQRHVTVAGFMNGQRAAAGPARRHSE
jgi:ComEC/Rec2-related protein